MRTVKIANMARAAAFFAILAGISFAQQQPSQFANVRSSFKDSRDGKTYKTLKIGNQTWMAENLNYQPQNGNSWCVDEDVFNRSCNKYGRAYDWETAMNEASSSNNNPSGVQGVCPDGWHLPSRAEWRQLIAYIGDSSTPEVKLKPKFDWYSNFSALPGGCLAYPHNAIYVAGHGTRWWAATELRGGILANKWEMLCGNAKIIEDYGLMDAGAYVRCVKN